MAGMTAERYCAEQIRLKENETFLGVAQTVPARFDPSFFKARSEGKAIRLPDLLSYTSREKGSRYRVREVKFKLEDRLVRKALTQLAVGVKQLLEQDPARVIDRLEIVVPLRGRVLREEERIFLGNSLEANRHGLVLDAKEVTLSVGAGVCPVTILVF